MGFLLVLAVPPSKSGMCAQQAATDIGCISLGSGHRATCRVRTVRHRRGSDFYLVLLDLLEGGEQYLHLDDCQFLPYIWEER